MRRLELLFTAALTLLGASDAQARTRIRRFEPTDLGLEEPGTLQVDAQLGLVYGSPPWRVLVPDFEVDLGILPELELGVDSSVAFEGDVLRDVFLHAAPDNLWASAKIGLIDARDVETHTAWALGVQIGPKIPIDPALHGVGYEALLLVGRSYGATNVALNAGAVVDPGLAVGRARPVGVELGLDARVPLPRSPFTLLGELGGVAFVSSPHEHLLHASAGLEWSAMDNLDVSALTVVGLLPGEGDRIGFMLGVTPRFKLW